MSLHLDVLDALDAAASAGLPAEFQYLRNTAQLDARAGDFPAVARLSGGHQVQRSETGIEQRDITALFLLALGPLDPADQDTELDAVREALRTAITQDDGLWALISDVREVGADAPVEDDQRGRQRFVVQVVEYVITIHTEE